MNALAGFLLAVYVVGAIWRFFDAGLDGDTFAESVVEAAFWPLFFVLAIPPVLIRRIKRIYGKA
jgi:hypothetical protein